MRKEDVMRANRHFQIAVMVATVLFFVLSQPVAAETPEETPVELQAGGLEHPECLELVVDQQGTIDQQEASIAELETQIAEKDALIVEKDALIVEKDALIEELQSML
jgi:hypothetical protein